MKISYKFFISFLLISLVPIATISAIFINSAQNSFEISIGNHFKQITNEKASAITKVIENLQFETEMLAESRALKAALRKANYAYSGKSEDEIQTAIHQIDSEWIKSKGETGTVDRILNNELSNLLKEYQSRHPAKYGEIFVTDTKGAVVGMTANLSDFYQADEGWWEDSYDEGRGGVFIDDRGFDKSVGAIVMGMVVPVIDNGEVTGILKINFKVREILDIVSTSLMAKNEHIFLLREQGDMLAHSEGQTHGEVSDTEKSVLGKNEAGFIKNINDDRIGGYSPVSAEIFTRVHNPGERKGISGEKWVPTRWYVFMELAHATAFAPVERLKYNVMILGVLTAIAVTLLAFVFSRTILGPIRRLSKGAEIVGKGNFEYKIDIKSRDEIGQLSLAFSEMVGRLKKSYAVLQVENLARREAEDSLRKSEERYALAQRAASIGNWDLNILTGDLQWSDTIYPVFGFEPGEFSATYAAFLDCVHPDDLQYITASVDAAVEEDKEYDIEHRVIWPDGTVRWVSERGDVFRDESGKPVRMLGIVQDITERKILEEQLRVAQKMEAVGQLAGGVAHDFNNILSAISNYTYLLKDNVKGGKSEDMLEKIHCLTGKASHITRGLLTFSRKQHIDPRPANLNEIITEAEKLLTTFIGEDIRFITRLSESELLVLADQTSLEQCLMNFATNARDAMPGGGSFIIETGTLEMDKVFVSAHGFGIPGRYATMSVADTGQGIDDEKAQKIFDPFFTTKEVGKGTGLGLAIVYGIVKQHKGYISVYSEPGRGTTFRLYFPMINADVEINEEKKMPCITGNDRTILVAEDEVEVRNSTCMILERSGFRTIQAVDGIDAIGKLREHRDEIELAVIDIIMPKKNGKEVYEEIKKIKPGLKAIFLSGYPADIIHNKNISDKGLNLVSKPVSPKELLLKIREVLEDEYEYDKENPCCG